MTDDRTPGPGEDRPQPPDASPETPDIPRTNPKNEGFVALDLARTVIAIPLLNELLENREKEPQELYGVIIDLRHDYPGGRDRAVARVRTLIEQAIKERDAGDPGEHIDEGKTRLSPQYVIATLAGETIQRLVRLDQPDDADPPAAAARRQAIHRIWPDFPIRALTTKSIATVKADAAQATFSAFGEEIVWAVIDSGIAKNHPHFRAWKNLDLTRPLRHRDFTGGGNPHEDAFGHGTHVAGIIAGQIPDKDDQPPIKAVSLYRDENGKIDHQKATPASIAGMAPRCKLVSLKVLDENGAGTVSNIIGALEEIQRVNGYGRRWRIHGVNLSVGYSFDPEWFACGQSPLCIEINRLVRSGVVVVVAAGNTGYGWWKSTFKGVVPAGADLTINDPGNAELAITVGSTHRERPHVYGVSYFSSKGPTGDGRLKPDLVAPGEKIISCAAGNKRKEAIEALKKLRVHVGARDALYIEDSGTSMAAPHVSGVIAAFLSIQPQFIGEPERVKEIFLKSATDLRRERNFQGYGLVDLMRAIQSV